MVNSQELAITGISCHRNELSELVTGIRGNHDRWAAMELSCFFRRPRFPIICNIDGELVTGGNLQQFERRLNKLGLPDDGVFPIVDATGEGWVLHPDLSAISPLTLDKRWTKARVIEMFNKSLNAQRIGWQYPQRSLANRRLDMVIRDVADLLNRAEQNLAADARKYARR